MTEQIKKRWVIVREPGRVPEKKRPMQNTSAGVFTLLRELVECRPEGTQLTVCELTWNDDLWVEDGHLALEIDSALAAGQ